MKRAATLETPEAGTGSATPELFAHEWAGGPDEVKVCKNPERFTVDGMPSGTSLTCLLGYSDLYNQWFVVWTNDEKLAAGLELRTSMVSCGTREEALVHAIDASLAYRPIAKNRKAVKCLTGLRSNLETGKKGLAPNTPAAEDDVVPTPEACDIAGAAIKDNPRNERERPQEYIDELAADIRVNGLLQRIAVVMLPPSDDSLPGVPSAPRYRLLYGGCRLRAVRQLGLTMVRAEVYPATLTVRSESRIIKAENLKRLNPDPIEEAQGYADHMAEFALTQEEMAKEVGKSRPVIANTVRLLELPEDVRDLLQSRQLTSAHGVALLRFKPDKKVADKFPSWPRVVSALAKIAVKEGASASMIEDGVPFVDMLLDALGEKGAVGLFLYQSQGAELQKHPAYFECGRDADYDAVFFEPAFYEQLAKQKKEEQAATEKKKKERQEKRAKKTPAGRTIDKLPRGSFVQIASDHTGELLLEVLPDDVIEDLKWYQWSNEKTTICTRPALAEKAKKAIEAIIDADRKAKVAPLLEQAKKKIAGVKKIGARETAMLLVGAHIDWGYGDTPSPLDRDAAKRQGIKLPNVFDAKNCVMLTAVAKADHVQLFRVWLDAILGDCTPDSLLTNGNARAFLRFLIEREDFGLLEETKAGEKEIIAKIQAEDWFKQELTAIEVEAAKEKKPTTQSGKKGKK